MVQQSEIEVIDAGGATMVVLRGEFDAATSTDVEAALAEAMNGDRTVVDLHAVTFVDSTVMSLFVIAQRRAEEAKIRLTFLPGNPLVMRLLHISGVDQLLSFARAPD